MNITRIIATLVARTAATLVAICVLAWTASADDGSTALTIIMDGEIVKKLTLADLDTLPQKRFTTATQWLDDDVEFSGVSLSAVLADAGAEGETLTMTALNAYSVEMPMDEVEEDYPIIATRMNGETMPVRDKGPYWVVYPYDSDPKFETETIYARSVWQLTKLEVVN